MITTMETNTITVREPYLDRPDPSTGVRVRRWTSSDARDQHFYFTSPCATTDGRWLPIISERTGHPNVHVIDRREGTIREVSRNRSGLLHGYVYPLGGTTGLAKGSPSLHAVSGRVVWIQDDALWTAFCGEAAAPQRLCALPAGWYSGFTDLSGCGRYACVAVGQPEAFADPADGQGPQMKAVLARFRHTPLVTRVMLIDCLTGAVTWDAAVPFWVTHVNVHPADPDRVIINQEGGNVGQRVWRLWGRTGRIEPLFPQYLGEHVSHENWDPAGTAVVYHGHGGPAGKAYVERRTWEGQLLQRLEQPGLPIAHATFAPDGQRFVCDLHQWGGDGTADGIVTWDLRDGEVRTLCRHGSSFKDQDCHPHPRATPDGCGAVFTSDCEGVCNVYEVELTA